MDLKKRISKRYHSPSCRKKTLPSAAPSPSNNELWSPRIQNQMDDLIHSAMPQGHLFSNQDIVHEIMVTGLKSIQAHISRGDLKILSRAIRELRYAFKIFQNYRDVRKVTIFGSARTKPNEPAYHMARLLARKLTQKGFMVITGAGPGIMQAGNEGALAGKRTRTPRCDHHGWERALGESPQQTQNIRPPAGCEIGA